MADENGKGKGMKKKHKAPVRCWMKYKLEIISPSRMLAACRLGQNNDPKKCKNCRHNLKERWEKRWGRLTDELEGKTS